MKNLESAKNNKREGGGGEILEINRRQNRVDPGFEVYLWVRTSIPETSVK